jgi:hypothetical protein
MLKVPKNARRFRPSKSVFMRLTDQMGCIFDQNTLPTELTQPVETPRLISERQFSRFSHMKIFHHVNPMLQLRLHMQAQLFR